MLQLARNKYFIGFFIIYLISVLALTLQFNQPFSDPLSILICFGIMLPVVSWLLLKTNEPAISDRPSFTMEPILVTGLVFFFVWYVTYGTAMINKMIPGSLLAVHWKKEIVIFIKKLLVFVIIPFMLYKVAGFSLKDFGFAPKKNSINRKTVLLFIILSVLILLYQYFFSGGARPLRGRMFTTKELITGMPLAFLWLFIVAGLIEEFFFRAVLQSRITVLLKSPVAGILISGLIFGLAHAPGLYLRGAESEGISEQLPFGFFAAYTISAMSLAGIFLGIVWYRTKNIYLVMALHAMVDLFPNFDEVVRMWQI
ncbi:MAG: CPBP family intramembrane metalloprotease [Ferruginibacter sp.]